MDLRREDFLKNVQVVISSDKCLKEIEKFEDKLKSRLESGVNIKVQAPGYETRMAILKETAKKEQLVGLSEEIYSYIASNIIDDVRRMIGALHKVSFYSEVEGNELTIERVTSVLEDLI